MQILGFGATLAEPALFTLAVTVDRLSRGKISQRQVVLSVALGVGTGTALGLLKIVIGFPLLPLLLAGYTLALLLTTMAGEILICVAWDSAGVTTGPVTVRVESEVERRESEVEGRQEEMARRR
eukprot:753961-Hanusia_phi.AAC.4